MGFRNTVLKLFKSFTAHEAGTVAITYALSAVPVILAMGTSVDYVRYAATQTHIQAAIDAGALAGAAAVNATDAQRIAFATAAFNGNIASGAAAGYPVTSSFVVNNKVLVANASVDMPTAFMRLAGIDEMAVEGTAEVGFGLDKKAEIALVLDYSGSMGDVSGGAVKYVAMKNAATDLVNDLSTANPDKVKFGLVPFSHHVYTTLPKAYVRGATGSGNWTGCTQDRKYPYNLTDATPTSANNSKWGQAMAPVHASSGCSGYAANSLTVMPLTNSFSNVKAQLAAMKPYAWTHIALGVEFGYHLLSNNAPYTEAVPYSDEETRKFMVVLTDGMQTEPAFGPGTTRTVAQGEANLEALCANAKASGITIITVAFDLDDTSTRQRLRNCSSDPAQHFFVADDATDLSAAFEAIKTAIATEIYLSK